ncbi:MAG: peptidylprolyl isomerase [Thermoplasmata archaeon]
MEEGTAESEEKERAETLKKGDLAYLDYDIFIIRPDEEELYDTTREESARENDMYDGKKIYSEVPFIVGQARFLPGLDEVLESAEIGKELSVVIPPEKGAGERDPKLVEIHSMREFARMEVTPEVGREVVIRNKKGTITQVAAGRVRVDFNDPLAGLSLRCNYKVTRKAQTREEKIRGILEMDYGSSEEFGLEVEGESAEILLPDICKYDEKWFIAKYKVVSDLREFADLSLIRFVEQYKKMTKEREEPLKDEGKGESEEESIPPEQGGGGKEGEAEGDS